MRLPRQIRRHKLKVGRSHHVVLGLMDPLRYVIHFVLQLRDLGLVLLKYCPESFASPWLVFHFCSLKNRWRPTFPDGLNGKFIFQRSRCWIVGGSFIQGADADGPFADTYRFEIRSTVDFFELWREHLKLVGFAFVMGRRSLLHPRVRLRRRHIQETVVECSDWQILLRVILNHELRIQKLVNFGLARDRRVYRTEYLPV